MPEQEVRKAVLSIEWDVYRLNVLALEWESGVVSEGLSQAEYVCDQVENEETECSVLKTSVESMKIVNKKETGKASGNMKQKVWTRLRNGLYGWRSTKVGKRRKAKTDDNDFSEDCRSATTSVGETSKWEPEILKSNSDLYTCTLNRETKSESGNLERKRKSTLGGGPRTGERESLDYCSLKTKRYRREAGPGT